MLINHNQYLNLKNSVYKFNYFLFSLGLLKARIYLAFKTKDMTFKLQNETTSIDLE